MAKRIAVMVVLALCFAVTHGAVADVLPEPGTMSSAELTLEKVGPTEALAGQTITYTFTITNVGEYDMDDINEYVQLFDDTIGGVDPIWESAGPLGGLAVGESAVIDVDYTIPANFNTIDNGGTSSANPPIPPDPTPCVDTLTNTATAVGVAEWIDDYGSSNYSTATATDSWDTTVYCPAALGDTVWLDNDGDGIQDEDEDGIEDVDVALYSTGDNGIAEDGGGDDELIGTTETDENGEYLFDNLFPGEYYVSFDEPDGLFLTQQDAGGDDAADSDADQTTGFTEETDLDAGETDLTWDAGLYELAGIGDYVWFDENGNGIQDGGELDAEGVSVELYDGDGVFQDSTTTNADGYYEFTDLNPGEYYVKFAALDGFKFTYKDQGGDDALDSDAMKNGMTVTTLLTSGEFDDTWDAGLVVDVPEPAVAGLVMLGVVALLRRRR